MSQEFADKVFDSFWLLLFLLTYSRAWPSVNKGSKPTQSGLNILRPATTQAAVGHLSDCGRMLQPITGFGLASGWEQAMGLFVLPRFSYHFASSPFISHLHHMFPSFLPSFIIEKMQVDKAREERRYDDIIYTDKQIGIVSCTRSFPS